MKILPRTSLLLLTVGVFALGGCESVKEAYGDIKSLWSDSAPLAEGNSGWTSHESWCYQTLGAVECHPRPVSGSAGRLVNVDPPSRYPMSEEDHERIAAESR